MNSESGNDIGRQRISTEALSQGAKISIVPPRSRFVMLLLPVILLAFISLLIAKVVDPVHSGGLMLVALIGSCLYVIYVMSRLIFGRERIVICGDEFEYRRGLIGQMFPKKFSVSEIQKFRLTKPHIVPRPTILFMQYSSWRVHAGLTGERLAFDVDDRTFRFGIQLEDDDATYLGEIISSYLTRDGKMNKQRP